LYLGILEGTATNIPASVRQQGHLVKNEIASAPDRHESVKGMASLAVIGQSLTNATQARGIEAFAVQGQVEGHRSAQIVQQPLGGLPVRDVVTKMEQGYDAHQGRWQIWLVVV